MRPALSLVTGRVEREKSFLRLIDSIVSRTTLPWQLIVADASETPYASTDSRIHVLHEKPRLTHSKGYNLAFRACSGEYVIWLNDDAEVCDNYDVAAVDFMRAHPQIGLGALHYSERGGEFHVNAAWDVIYANFGIFRREVGDQVHHFDEQLSMYGADNSFVLRVLMAGYGVADIPESRIIHHSEQDEIRNQNQQNRRTDSKILIDTYMPYRRVWTQTFKKHYIFSGHVPWTHGVRPETVTV